MRPIMTREFADAGRTRVAPGSAKLYAGGCEVPPAAGRFSDAAETSVVAVCGDGGFMYNVQELATMKHYNIPLVAIVFNDNAFGNVKRIQRENYRGRTIVSDLTNPDFVALAQSFGIAGMRAEGPDALQGTLKEALASNEPVLIEVPVGEMPSPWQLIMRTL